MPIIGTKGAMSAQAFGWSTQAPPPPGGPFWVAREYSADQSSGSGIALDSSKNVYTCGIGDDAGTSRFYFVKYNNSGTRQSQVSLVNSTYQSGATSIKTDSSDNIYLSGYYSTGTALVGVVVKYNSSLTLQWQRALSLSGVNVTVNGCAVDSSGNVYVVGEYVQSTVAYAFLVKYNSSGTLQWQRRLSGNGPRGKGVAIDASSNVIVTGTYFINGFEASFVAQYNSSGTIQWQRSLEYNGINDVTCSGVAIDSSSNVYVPARVGSSYAAVTKINSSGTTQWSLGLSVNAQGSTAAVDSSGNVYFGGAQIAKADSSGNLLWQRSNNFTSFTFATDSFDNLYIGGTFGDVGTVKLPANGSKTGSYAVTGGGDFTYSVTTRSTTTNPGYTVSTSSFTDAAGSLTDAAGGLTAGTFSLTTAVTTL